MFTLVVARSLAVAFSPALTAGDTVKLSGPMPVAEAGDVESFLVTSDGARIVYRADQAANDVFELYSAPAVGSAPAIRLHQALPPSRDVSLVYFVGAGDRVVFATNTAIQYKRLFSVPADGSGAPTLLSGPDVASFALGASGTRVVFTVDDGRLFSVPIDGSSPPIELAPDRTLYSGTDFWVDGAGSRVVFTAPGDLLCSVPIDGSAAPLELFGPLHPHHHSEWMTFASDGVHAYYVENYGGGYGLYSDLYWIALDGSQAPIRLTSDGDEETLEFYENAALGRVVYRAGNLAETMLYGIDRDGTDLADLDPLTLHVSKLRLADDGTTVVFGNNSPTALRRVPIDGSQAAVTFVPSNGQAIGQWELVGSDVIFVRSTPVAGGTFSGLYRVPIAGGVAQLLNGPPAAGQGVVAGPVGLVVSPDEHQVVFASSGPSGTTLQAVPIDGSAAPRELAPPGSFVDVGFAENGARVVFRGSEGTGDVTALFSTPLDGSEAPVRCNAFLAPGESGDVTTVQSEYDGRSVVYTADEYEDGVVDLYSVKADGSAPSTRLTASLGGVGDVESVVLAPSARRAVFTYSSTAPFFTRLYGVSTDPITAPLELDSRAAESAFPAPLLLTPDGSRVVYRSALPDSRLFSVDRRAAPVTLAVPLAGEIGEPHLTPDGATVVFIANLTGRVLLHAVPADGSGPARPLDTSAPTFTDVLRFLVSPDGQQVVFVADRDRSSVYELYRVPIDGSAAPVKLSATPATGGDVESIAISANGETIVYLGDEVVDGRAELFAVPLLGGAPPARLTQLPQDFGFIANDWIVSDDGELAFYRADAATAGQVELWAVRTDGSIPPAKLSGTMTAQGDVSSFLVTSDARHVVFLANKRSASVLELFRRSAGGPVLPVDDFSELADVTEYRLTPDGRRVVYLADRDVNGKLELFAARLDGSTPPRRLNDDLPAEADIRLGFVPLADGSVLYRADQEEDEVIELFHLLRTDTVQPADAPTRSASVVR